MSSPRFKVSLRARASLPRTSRHSGIVLDGTEFCYDRVEQIEVVEEIDDFCIERWSIG